MALMVPNHAIAKANTASATLGLVMNRITALDSLMIVLRSLRKNFIISPCFFAVLFCLRYWLAFFSHDKSVAFDSIAGRRLASSRR